VKIKKISIALLAISLIIVFSIPAFTQEWQQYTNKDGSYRVECTVGTTPVWKKYYNKDGTISRFEDYDVKGDLNSTTYYNSDGTESRIEYSDGTMITYTYNSDGSRSRAVYSDGTTIDYNADGSYTVRRPDGSKIVADKDGNITEYDKNGRVVLKLDYEEDTKPYQPHHYEKEKDGSITYYTYNKKDNSYRKEFTEHADGRVTWYDENGNVKEVFYPVTMVRVEGPEDKDLYNGNVQDIYYADEVPPGVDKDKTHKETLYYTKNKDGSKSYWRSPNSTGLPVFVVHPDGSVTYYNNRDSLSVESWMTMWSCTKKYTQHPDGSRTYYFQDRRTHTKHPDGSVTYYVEEKKHKTEHPDGSTTYYDENENVKSFRDSDGNLVFYDEDGNITKVEHPDGSVTHYRDGKKDYTEDFFGKRSYYYEVLSRSQMYSMAFWTGPAYTEEYKRTLISERETDEDDLFNKAQDITVRTYTDKDGNEVTEYPDGLKKVCKKDGSCTYYDQNGDVIREVDKNGETVYYGTDGNTVASEAPDGDIVIYETLFGDSAMKAIMEQYQVEIDKNGLYIEMRRDWETGNVDAPPPNEDAGETGSFDVGTPTPGAGDTGMEDDPFNEGMPPGMDPLDNGVPYEMMDPGVGGSGGTEMIDPELQMDDGSMTLE